MALDGDDALGRLKLAAQRSFLNGGGNDVASS
jgi:hypothetical protein